MKNMNNELKRLFIVLGLYSLSGGIFYIFQELWMEENNLSIGTISNVYSLCAILAVSTIFLSSNLIKKDQLKKFSCLLFLTKAIVMLLLFILNKTGLNILIKFLIMLDYVIDVELWASFYPLITQIKKDDKIYAIKDLVYDASYYIGVFITGVILGKNIGFINIDYNFYILIGSLITFMAFVILFRTNIQKYNRTDSVDNSNGLLLVVNKIKKDKISKLYLLFVLFGSISYNCVTSLMILILANYFNFSEYAISNFSIILGLGAVLIGSLVLIKLTFKNNYINITLKYGVRVILYILAFIFNSKLLILLSFIYVKISGDTYIDVIESPYVNRYDDKEQLAFNNLNEMIDYVGESIGIFLCGLVIIYNLRYIFLIGSIFALIQIIFAMWALYLRNKESSR